MNEINDILIVGAGQAGGCAAATLRGQGFAGRIILAGAEPHRPYERPPLSKAILMDSSMDDAIFLHRQELHDKLELDWRPNEQVAKIDVARGCAVTADDRTIEFDRCLIATGGRARTLAGIPDNMPHVFTLRGLNDAQRIRNRLVPGASVVVIGAGFLGLEFAGLAAQRNLTVTVLESGDRILGRAAPRLFSDWLSARFEKQGVQFICDASIASVAEDGSGARVALKDGRRFSADFVLIAIGQEPNVELAREAGIALDNGIAVDASCETSIRGVFAAGDCASHFNPYLGRRIRLESWQNAQEQAQVAARAMVGIPAAYDVIPWFWSDQLGMNFQMLGLPDPAYRYVMRGVPESGKFAVFGFAEDQLRYALTVNSGGDIRPLQNILKAKTPVDAAALTDTSRSIRELAKKVTS